MVLNILDAGEFVFHIEDKNGAINKDIDSHDSRAELPHPARVTIKQRYALNAGFGFYLRYFIRMFFFTIVRAFFLFRKSISEEISPIYIDAELETLSETDESTLYFERSSFSPFNMLFTPPKLTSDRSVKICSVKYFIDEYTVKVNRKKQFLRSISSPAMLLALDALVFTYAGIEELFNVCAFCIYMLPFIAAFTVFMVIRAKRAYKKYTVALENQVGYMNREFKKVE